MEFIPLKTERLEQHCNLAKAIQNALENASQTLQENDILIIASKVVSYSEGRLEDYSGNEAFEVLVRQESDQTFGGGMMTLALKHQILIPNAGIDKSNVPEGKAVLWPKKPFQSAGQLREDLKKSFNLKNIGIVIGDSHCQPLRQGVTGIAIAWAGFSGIRDDRGTKDLFGKTLHYTQTAMADNLASAAELLMGGGDQSTPFVIARNVEVSFTEKQYASKDYFIDPGNCIFRGIYNQKL